MSIAITLVADFASPYCYVTEVAVRRAAAEHGCSIRTLAFELYPPIAEAPAAPPPWEPELDELARREGLTLRMPRALPRTRKAHEAATFAAEHERGPEMRRAIYHALWEEGRDVGRIDVLAALAGSVGLDPTDAKIALDIDRHLDAVLGEEAAAARLRITVVPVLYLGTGPRARVLVGARDRSGLDAALREAL